MRQFDRKTKARQSRALTNIRLDQLIRSIGPRRTNRPKRLLAWLLEELLGELGDLMGEARNLPARIVLVNDVALRRLHQLWLGAGESFQRRVAVAALDRFLDGTNRAAHLSTTRLVDDGAAGNLAGRLLGGSGIGHVLKFLRR